jgi:hypothetical protein
MNRRTFMLWCAGAAAAAVGCSRVPPLTNTRDSSEALAGDVLDAFAGRDRAALDRLVLSEQEFRDHVWPDLPAARPERNLPFSYVWGDLHQKSDLYLARTLREIGGRRYTLRHVTFAGKTEYGSYRVHRKATLHVRDAAGVESELRVCGSIIEKSGAWKVFSYVVDE